MDKKSISVPEIRRILGLGKTESYWLIKKGYFKTIMLFGKIRVMTDSFEEWYANQFHYKRRTERRRQNWRHTMSIRETADILGIAPTTVYSLISKNLFTVLTISGKKRIEKRALKNDMLIKANITTTTRRLLMMFEEKIAKLNSQQDRKKSYSVPEIQKILKVERHTVYKLIKEGHFKAAFIGGKWRISRLSFDLWLDGKE